MKKIKFAIIGNPVSHSLSPTMHNYWFKKYNINAEYDLLDISENEIQNVINRIKDSQKRPIAFQLSKNELIELIKKRSIFYSKAMYKINCENCSKNEIVENILNIYEAH